MAKNLAGGQLIWPTPSKRAKCKIFLRCLPYGRNGMTQSIPPLASGCALRNSAPLRQGSFVGKGQLHASLRTRFYIVLKM